MLYTGRNFETIPIKHGGDPRFPSQQVFENLFQYLRPCSTELHETWGFVRGNLLYVTPDQTIVTVNHIDSKDPRNSYVVVNVGILDGNTRTLDHMLQKFPALIEKGR
jgi:hypothetical protein